jgi:putative transcriptional regulator
LPEARNGGNRYDPLMKSIATVLLCLIGATTAFAQAPETGALLVATDDLRDPAFKNTVVLLLHYGPDGALGVAINRPTWIESSEAFPDMPVLDSYEGRVFFGGPAAPANLVTLIRIPDIGDLDLEPIVDDVYLSADPQFFEQLDVSIGSDETLRVYAGHATWDTGQLEREIEAGIWRVAPASSEIIFANDPLELWERLRAPAGELMVYQSAGKHRRSQLVVGVLHSPKR